MGIMTTETGQVLRTYSPVLVTTWSQEAKLLSSDGAAFDAFGLSVSLSGDIALIGAFGDHSAKGSAYVFTRAETTWSQQAKIIASDGAPLDSFGISVSIDGDTALIGAEGDDDTGDFSGSAYVFIRTGTTWTQQAKLIASDGAEHACFGRSVSLSGDTALIGAYGDDSHKGSAYVFTRMGTNWTQQTKLLASDGSPEDRFSWSVSLSRDTAFIGAIYDNDNGAGSGSVYVFTRTGTTWTQQAKLLASDGAFGDEFGNSVSLDDDAALIGAHIDDDTGISSGSVYVFIRNGTAWAQQAKLIASDGAEDDSFGISVSLDGTTALIGAEGDDNHTGSAYVFTRSPDLTIDIASGLGVNAVIRNNGIKNVSDVVWQINVEGGILQRINKTMNGTIDIQAGDSKIIKTGLFFGLGPIVITVKVADVEKIAEGNQILIFSIVRG